MSDVLDVHDVAVADWLSDQMKKVGEPGGDPDPAFGGICLLVGCSIARDARLEARNDDPVVNRARGGATWSSLSRRLPEDISAWRRAADAFRMSLGPIVIWLSGNDGYEKGTGRNLMTEGDAESAGRLERIMRDTIVMAHSAAPSVVVLGPLPRMACDRLLPWEHTAAFFLDRKTKEATDEVGGTFVSLGRGLTKKQRNRHVVKPECDCWFMPDGIHLSQQGYSKLGERSNFPAWLRLGDH